MSSRGELSHHLLIYLFSQGKLILTSKDTLTFCSPPFSCQGPNYGWNCWKCLQFVKFANEENPIGLFGLIVCQ